MKMTWRKMEYFTDIYIMGSPNTVSGEYLPFHNSTDDCHLTFNFYPIFLVFHIFFCFKDIYRSFFTRRETAIYEQTTRFGHFWYMHIILEMLTKWCTLLCIFHLNWWIIVLFWSWRTNLKLQFWGQCFSSVETVIVWLGWHDNVT